jgi:pimeloyl-ACP methyl ester carboxylesterase
MKFKSLLGIYPLIYCLSFACVHKFSKYRWKNSWDVHYVKSGTRGPPLLLLPGFGVGTFHYNRNYKELSEHFQVYSIDLLGQGNSWPEEVTKEHQLFYGVETWQEQISYFIENVIGEEAHIAGNSLGGLLSAAVGAERPELVKSIILLNAAPFWAFMSANRYINQSETARNRHSLNASSSMNVVEERFPWNGVLPAPDPLLAFGSMYFDNLRKPLTIKSLLNVVYANPYAIDDSLVNQIISAASHPSKHSTYLDLTRMFLVLPTRNNTHRGTRGLHFNSFLSQASTELR